MRSVLKNGFTLIEMLVVMALVALLLTIALPRYFGALDNSKDVALQENLKVLRITLDKFYADKGRYPQTLEELVEHRYLRAVPIDPITESADTWILIPPEYDAEDGEDSWNSIADIRSGATGRTKEGVAYESF
ncbi:MAG: type II secretion system GspH family protein [Betaproteobacteria bacterium]|nr:type II secretion system GspH family protein [Betaproteobacteria bacterium]